MSLTMSIKMKLICQFLFGERRQLAKISRSTRGIVLLLCDLSAARRVMSEAQRLKMTGGHFIWIWADISSTAEFFQPNSVPNIDEKDQVGSVKASYDEFGGRKSQYDKSSPPAERQYQPGNKRPGQNNTRYKSLNTNTKRFHHIIGLRKPGDEDVFPDNKFGSDMTAGRVPIRDKRTNKKLRGSQTLENDYTGSVESGKADNLNIKNINSHEFDANYFDPFSTAREGGDENVSVSGASDEHADYDYEKRNPYQAPDPESLAPTTRRPLPDGKIIEKPKARESSNQNNKPTSPPDKVPFSELSDEDDDLDSENYSETSSDLKAKRADNFPSTFNISSHVFFHHFKDFPVGLLALRHLKMHVDRVFVRSAVRLFASTWSRVEQDEELRVASGGKVDGQKNNWADSWSGDDYDYDDVNNNYMNKKQKNKSTVNVNSRHNNARGSRKYKRDAVVATPEASISNLVNTSASNSNSKFIDNLTNKTNSQHVSDLNSHRSDDGNRSNNDNIKHDNHIKINDTESDSHAMGSRELVRELNVAGKIEIQKRQNSWWQNNLRNQKDRTNAVLGTPQYKGGCFGIPSRVDINRSELFSRWDNDFPGFNHV